jgi:hypothetical protein
MPQAAALSGGAARQARAAKKGVDKMMQKAYWIVASP